MEFEHRFKHPSSIIIAGPSQAGKTELVMRIISNPQMFDTHFKRIVYIFGDWQAKFENLADKGVIMLSEIPPSSYFENFPGDQMVIFDDLMSELSKSEALTRIFTRGCHHWRMTVIYLVQNIFYGGRTARINSNYLLLLKNPSDNLQVMNLAKQIYPENSKFLLEVFRDATRDPYTYLLIDLHQTTPEQCRLRTRIFPGESPLVYISK